ncbi:hypothetical protein V3N99_08110 [Dermatophilaceae bacterium Soc4.6]
MTRPGDVPAGAAAAGVDGRSVGELLLDADLTARAALWDPDPDRAMARVRSWGEVVDAAADLWSAIPDRTGDPSMRRIHGITQGLHHTHRQARWPGAGDGDPALEAVATALARAAELVRARRHPTAALSAVGHADAEAARTRVMHVLSVSGHAVAVSLDRHARDLQRRLDARHTLPPGESLQRARDASRRIATTERLAASYLDTRWPTALTRQHRESRGGPDSPASTGHPDRGQVTRLEQALARWNLQAHRTLTGPPTAANLDWIAQVQRTVTAATGIIGSAAASRGLLDPQQHTHRLLPALTDLEHAWGRLAADLEPMLGRHRRLDPDLLLAGNDVHAALRDITHHHASLASPAAMATRVDLAAVTGALHRDVSVAVDLAHVVRDTLQDPALSVAARGAQAMAAASSAAPTLAAWVNAGDVHHDRQIPPPPPVRAVITRHAQQIIGHAMTADSASAALHAAATRNTPPTPTGEPRPSSGRGHEDRSRTVPRISALNIGCER